MNGASYVISGNVEDFNGVPHGQLYRTSLNPDGLYSYITEPDGVTKMHSSRISMGMLELSDLASGSGNSAKFITSMFTAKDAVTYYRKDAGMTAGNATNVAVAYSRRGQNVTVSFNMEMTNGNGWVKLADIRPGYKPFNNDDAGALLGSMSYAGASCKVYASAGGWYTIPSLGKGGYSGSVSFVTRDAYPTNDVMAGT